MKRTSLVALLAIAASACADDASTTSTGSSSSVGSATSTSGSGGTTGATTSQTSDASSSASAGGGGSGPTGFVVPVWSDLVKSACILQTGRLTVTPDGTVAVLGESGGDPAHPIVFGEGLPNELAISDRFHLGMGWYAGDDGHMLRASQVTGFAQPAGTGEAGDLSAAGDGSVLVGGTFANHVYFYPGTPYQTELVTLTATNGSNADIAYDPFLLRYAADGTPGTITRGRTPSPLLTTWFNYTQRVVANPDGSVITAGDVDGNGFVLGDGKPNATTMNVGAGGYIARYEADGHVGWVLKIQGNLGATELALGADGSIYAVARTNGGTIAPGTAGAVTIPASVSSVVMKLSPTGSIDWVRTIASTGQYSIADLAVDPSGAVIIPGYAAEVGDLTIGDATGAPLTTLSAAAPEGMVLRIASNGTIDWAKLLGAGVDYASSAAVLGNGSTWISALLDPGTTELVLDGGQTVTLPPYMGQANALIELDAAGNRKAAFLVSQDFGFGEMRATPDGGLAAVGMVWFTATSPALGAAMGTTPLPIPTQDEQGMLVVLKLAPG